MRFTKMQGLGNDYLYFYGSVPEDVQSLCPRLCDRHFGVGADGLIFIGSSWNADYSMRIFNADGSEAEMCGNGIRCVGKFLYDKGLTRKRELTIETQSGIRSLQLHMTTEGNRVESATVDMGRGVVVEENVVFTTGIGVGTLILVGNPHLVLFSHAVEDLPVYLWGPRIEVDERFDGGVNVEFVQVLSDTRLRMRVWERGSGVTLACGTGACAAAFAAVKRGYCPADRPVEVVLDGGSLFVTVSRDGTVLMEGPAVTVFEGEINA